MKYAIGGFSCTMWAPRSGRSAPNIWFHCFRDRQAVVVWDTAPRLRSPTRASWSCRRREAGRWRSKVGDTTWFLFPRHPGSLWPRSHLHSEKIFSIPIYHPTDLHCDPDPTFIPKKYSPSPFTTQPTFTVTQIPPSFRKNILHPPPTSKIKFLYFSVDVTESNLKTKRSKLFQLSIRNFLQCVT